MRTGAKAVKDLLDGHEGEHLRDELNDGRVVGEEEGQVEAEDPVDHEVENTKETRYEEGLDKFSTEVVFR